MKRAFVISCFYFLALQSVAQGPDSLMHNPDPAKEIQIVEASCGQCMFGLSGDGCDLAVRIKGESYYVDGTDIHSHGDAHASDGFCLAIRKAQVQGEVISNRFRVTYFKLLPEEKTDKK